MITVVTLLLAAAVLGLIAVAMGWILGWANRAFHVHVDPKVGKLNDVLPGANCGGCGYVGCNEYAEAVAKGECGVELCAPGGADCVTAMANIMGVEAGDKLPFKAVVHCSADQTQRKQILEYRGEKTCQAANLMAGVQGCTYGCLGMGDCEVSCAYDAIHIVDGLAKVDYDKCVGCKACETACPRHIISMVPFKAKEILVISCSNKDQGVAVKEVCSTGCIGCKACVKPSDGLISMEGALPVVDYDKYDPSADTELIEASMKKCRMESMLVVGTPSPEDLSKTEGEELPEVVKADFKTTVDDTEWRG